MRGADFVEYHELKLAAGVFNERVAGGVENDVLRRATFTFINFIESLSLICCCCVFIYF